MAGQLQFVFGNPTRKKSKRRTSVRKKARRTSKKKNPQYYLYRKGRKVTKGTVFPKTSELNALRSMKEKAGKNIAAIDKKLTQLATAGKGMKRPASAKKAVTQLRSLQRELTKTKESYKKELAKFKKANQEKKDLTGKGYKARLKDIKAQEKASLSKFQKGIKKADAVYKKALKDAEKKKGGSVAKKKKKATRKKARKKVTRKKSVRKKAKKKVTRKKTRKKATRKKAKKKVTRKKAVRRKKKTTRKKSTRKKAGRKKARKKTRRRRKKAVGVGAFKKSQTKAMSKRGLGKGKTKSWKVKKGKKRYTSTMRRSKRNPFFGGNMKLKNLLKHEMAEATGLALGGFSHSGINDLISRQFPTAADWVSRLSGPFAGSVLPLLSGVVIGALNDRYGKKNKMVGNFAKGVIGAGVVGLGATAYELALGGGGTMAGKLAHSYPALEGEYSQLGMEPNYLGEYNQMGAAVPHSFDSELPLSEHGEDFGADDPYTIGQEWESFEGEYDQMG